MSHRGWSAFAPQIAAIALALTLLLAPAAHANEVGGSAPPSVQFGPFFAQLVNGGGSSLTVSSNGVVMECSGRLGGTNKPALACDKIGVIFAPPSSGLYHIVGFGNSAGHWQGRVFFDPTHGIVWGCSQTSDENGLPSGKCVRFNSIAADATPPAFYVFVPATNAALGSVHGLSWVTFTIPQSNGAVFECTAFLSKGTSGTPFGKCAKIGTITAPGKGAFVTTYSLGDVDFFYSGTSIPSTTTRLGQCVRDYNPSTPAPVGACIK
jgi:hypothetical protein